MGNSPSEVVLEEDVSLDGEIRIASYATSLSILNFLSIFPHCAIFRNPSRMQYYVKYGAEIRFYRTERDIRKFILLIWALIHTVSSN